MVPFHEIKVGKKFVLCMDGKRITCMRTGIHIGVIKFTSTEDPITEILNAVVLTGKAQKYQPGLLFEQRRLGGRKIQKIGITQDHPPAGRSFFCIFAVFVI